jgi:hypothetical protein
MGTQGMEKGAISFLNFFLKEIKRVLTNAPALGLPDEALLLICT